MRLELGKLEDVKSVNLAEYMMRDGVKLKYQRAGSYQGHCPFHEDSSPSLSVNLKGRTWLWHCFGCGAGGDIVKYVMKRQNLNFAGAMEKLSGAGSDENPGLVEPSVTQETFEPVRASKVLTRVAEYYHEVLKENKQAQGYLKKRGFLNAELIERYKIGFCDGSLPKDAEWRADLEAIGILARAGYEHFYNCVVFPVTDTNGNIVSMYGRHMLQKRHLYLPGPHAGVFNSSHVKNSKKIFVSEGIIDALSLIQLGIHETISLYGTNGFTAEHEELLSNPDLEEVYFCLDADEAGQKATKSLVEKLANKGLKFFRVKFPEGIKDANDFLISGKTKEDLLAGVEEIKTAISSQPSAVSEGEKPTAGFEVKESESEIYFQNCKVGYRVRGLNVQRVDTLKVTLKMETGEGYHLDTFDLYSSKARQDFVRQSRKVIGAEEGDLLRDLRMITDRLEIIRSKMLETGSKQEDFQMTTQEKLEALEILRSPDLIEKILEDAKACAYVGEEKNFLLGYLISVSRKLKNPLALLVISQSGAGKTELQDKVLSFTPPEDFLKLTRLTDQSLFYQEEEGLMSKLLAIEEEAGAEGAGYSIRHLLNGGRMTSLVTMKDERTGNMRSKTTTVKTQTSVMITTTYSEVNFETYNRFLVATTDESREQTKRILEIQRHLETYEGVLEKKNHEKIQRRHHNMQRLLEAIEIINPYAEKLLFIDSLLRSRREQKKYHGIIKAVAFLRQHQKEVKRGHDGRETFRYIEVDREDIRIANELAIHFLPRGLDEMTPQTRELLKITLGLVQKRITEEGKQQDEIEISLRQIREHSGWSDYAVRKCVTELVRLEYLVPVSGKNGKRFMYRLMWDGAEGAQELGLMDVKTL